MWTAMYFTLVLLKDQSSREAMEVPQFFVVPFSRDLEN